MLPPQTQEGATPDAEQEAQPLAWLPASLASVALRLQALDAALVYKEGQHPAREDLQVKYDSIGIMGSPRHDRMLWQLPAYSTISAFCLCSLFVPCGSWF